MCSHVFLDFSSFLSSFSTFMAVDFIVTTSMAVTLLLHHHHHRHHLLHTTLTLYLLLPILRFDMLTTPHHTTLHNTALLDEDRNVAEENRLSTILDPAQSPMIMAVITKPTDKLGKKSEIR